MMKTVTALILALLALCAAPALADDYTGETDAQTTVQLELEETYTLLIPPTLSIPLGQQQTKLAVEVTGLRLLAPRDGQERVLVVKPSSATGELKHADGAVLPYALAPEAMTFRESAAQEMLVSIEADAWNRAPAGDYTGVVTFSMECVYMAQ